jgi:hypothetical protein
MKKLLGSAAVVILIIAIGGSYVFPKLQLPVGATPGSNIDSPDLTRNGVVTYEYRKALSRATTTVCAIRSPQATSTLVSTELKITTASSTAVVFSAAKATTAFATTTSLLEFSFGSGVQGSAYLPATSTAVDSKYVFAPNDWVVWGLEGIADADLTDDKLLGVCQAQFRVI